MENQKIQTFIELIPTQIHNAIEQCIETNNRYLIIFENYIDCSKDYVGTNNKDDSIKDYINSYYNYNVFSIYDTYENVWEDNLEEYFELAEKLREEYDKEHKKMFPEMYV